MPRMNPLFHSDAFGEMHAQPLSLHQVIDDLLLPSPLRIQKSLTSRAHHSRFYLILRSRDDNAEPIVGSVYFRQDQLHIDLFVFFSVFFSCFFLFLSACLIAWKAKSMSDERRALARHAIEMISLAQRPFARQIVVVDRDDDEEEEVQFHRPVMMVNQHAAAAKNLRYCSSYDAKMEGLVCG